MAVLKLEHALKRGIILKSWIYNTYHNERFTLLPGCIPKNPKEGSTYEFAVRRKIPEGASVLYQHLAIGEIIEFAEIEIIEKQEIRRAGRTWTIGSYRINRLLEKQKR